MKRLRAVVFTLAALPALAYAAEITRIASSFEDDRPFGMYFDLGFERTQQKALISREFHEGGKVQERPELRYLAVDLRANLDVRIGLWQDLELRYAVPFVLMRNEYWGYGMGFDRTNSSVAANANNCIAANGELLDPACPTSGAGSAPMFAVPGETLRAGLGDMTFGLAYAFFNQKKDDTKPTWIAGLDYQAPTADKLDPTVPTAPGQPGDIGDRVHRYKLYTSFSRRMGAVDPYFHVYYTVPYHGPGWYSNCDHPSPENMAHPENCNTPQWTRASTGIAIPHQAGLLFGSEFNAFEQPSKHQRVAIDLRLMSDYIGPGRYYNELSGRFRKLLYTGDYLRVGGSLGVNAHTSSYISLHASATLLYNTPHTLTDEPIGRDMNGDGLVNLTSNTIEINPSYDFRADVASRRFRISENYLFRLNLLASVHF